MTTAPPLQANWRPADSDKWYFDNFTAPADSQSLLWTCFCQPALNKLGLCLPQDTSYGRLHLPFTPEETAMRQNPDFSVEDVQVFHGPRFKRINSSNQLRVKSYASWITYQIWQRRDLPSGKQRADLIYLHGISDFAGAFIPHATQFLQAGYRVILPDLPGHGRSSGLHVYLPDIDDLADAVHLVRQDLKQHDQALDLPQRPTFLSGSSMGGFTAASYTIRYASQSSPSYSADFPLSGAVYLCPMLSIAADSRPNILVELAAKLLRTVAGRAPFAAANKGKNSEDPKLEQRFMCDCQTYHGKLRIATGLAILKGLIDIETRFNDIGVPFLALHGTGDRVTDYKATIRLHEVAKSQDKSIKLFDGYEHVLLRKGLNAADDARRQNVILEMLAWLEKRTK